MPNLSNQPRILFVTAEATFIPEWTGSRHEFISAHTEGFGDFPVKLISDLLDLAADIHVAQPDYRKIFAMLSRNEQTNSGIKLPSDRAHFAEDRAFFYSNPIHYNSELENIRISLSFQREVINQIVPRVQPDLIHCHDWMTGLIPAMAKHWGIPCLFTVQSLRSAKSPLSIIEDRGIDGAAFWQHLFYDRYPGNYEETRDTNPLDFLLSGILAAHQVNTARPEILADLVTDRVDISYTPLRQVMVQKLDAGCACEIPAPPDSLFNPTIDKEQEGNHVMRQCPFFSDNRSMTQSYIDLYERILQRTLAGSEHNKAGTIEKNSHTKKADGKAISDRKRRITQSGFIPKKWISTPAMASF